MDALRRPRVVVLGAIVLAAVLVLAFVAIVRDRQSAPPVVLYGDSLSAQASEHFVDLVGGEADVTLRVFGGTAPCDWLDTMRFDAEAIEPRAVVIQFAGNAFTPCMRGPDGGDLPPEEIAARYAADLETATEIFTDAGARVHLVTPPAGVGRREPVDLGTISRELAQRGGRVVEVVDAGEALQDEHGEYPVTLPCLPHEGPEHGCEDGRIAVRAPDGMHFCDDPGGALACPEYSSGAWRFARAMAASLPGALGP